MNYQVIPIRESFLHKVRNTQLDDQNQSVETFVAKGGEPCRDVLRRAVEGEVIIAAPARTKNTGQYLF